MYLFSLLKSSVIEILFSKRLVAFFYGIAGLFVMLHLFSSSRQFIDAYYTLGEFDVTLGAFFFITVGLFLPFHVTGALILRALIQRVRLAIWARNAFTFYTDRISLTPAEAGVIVDTEFNRKELVATLLDLHTRGVIELTIHDDNSITVMPADTTQPLNLYEQQLMDNLFPVKRPAHFSSFGDHVLIRLAEGAHKVLIQQLQLRKMLQQEKGQWNKWRWIFRVIYSIAGLVGGLNLYAMLFEYENITRIEYPRYPVYPVELYLLIGLLVVVAAIIISGFWPKFSNDYLKNPQHLIWMEAAGFMLYQKTVYKDRLSIDNIETQDTDTIRRYAPYAVAFGIIEPTEINTQKILQLMSSDTGHMQRRT